MAGRAAAESGRGQRHDEEWRGWRYVAVQKIKQANQRQTDFRAYGDNLTLRWCFTCQMCGGKALLVLLAFLQIRISNVGWFERQISPLLWKTKGWEQRDVMIVSSSLGGAFGGKSGSAKANKDSRSLCSVCFSWSFQPRWRVGGLILL